jgi:hypothetical protein
MLSCTPKAREGSWWSFTSFPKRQTPSIKTVSSLGFAVVDAISTEIPKEPNF